MARRTILFAVTLALVCGCGQPAPDNLSERGLGELRSGQYDAAIATCTEAIEENRDNAEAYLYRGRAYQFRNAMGDPHRAIADFGEAIRLAPESSDAYYSRAIVYRDLGEAEQADADERAARVADGRLDDVDRRLPDYAAEGAIAKARHELATEAAAEAAEAEKSADLQQQASGDRLPKSEAERRELYKKLKEDFEPGFGSLRFGSGNSSKSPSSPYRRPWQRPDESARPQTAASGTDALGMPEALFPQTAQPGSGLPLGQSLQNPLQPVTPTAPPQSGPSQFGTPPATGQTARPLPQSPFGRQMQATAESGPQVRSPFPQRPAAPTGRVSTNPFEQQSFGPFDRPAPVTNGNPYSNPAVRPPFPRDYIP